MIRAIKFVTKKEFEDQINNNAFYEYARIFENYYGTLKKNVDLIFEKNDVFTEISKNWC